MAAGDDQLMGWQWVLKQHCVAEMRVRLQGALTTGKRSAMPMRRTVWHLCCWCHPHGVHKADMRSLGVLTSSCLRASRCSLASRCPALLPAGGPRPAPQIPPDSARWHHAASCRHRRWPRASLQAGGAARAGGVPAGDGAGPRLRQRAAAERQGCGHAGASLECPLLLLSCCLTAAARL